MMWERLTFFFLTTYKVQDTRKLIATHTYTQSNSFSCHHSEQKILWRSELKRKWVGVSHVVDGEGEQTTGFVNALHIIASSASPAPWLPASSVFMHLTPVTRVWDVAMCEKFHCCCVISARNTQHFIRHSPAVICWLNKWHESALFRNISLH